MINGLPCDSRRNKLHSEAIVGNMGSWVILNKLANNSITMRPIIQELTTKFAGTDVFIIGGGNSLRNFNFDSLKGKNVIALNSAYKYVDENAVLYWADATWGGSNHDKGLFDHPSRFKFSSRINADTLIQSNKLGAGGCHWLKKTGDYGYDPNVNNVRGNNSGTNAINFAINLHANRVILLGFDMGYVFGRTHFHDHHEQVTASRTYTEQFIPSIESLAKEIKHLPVKIINCSNHSNLKCFEFGDIKDYL